MIRHQHISVKHVLYYVCSNFLSHSDLDDLFDVQKELNPVSAKWKSIGIALRININTLDGINTCENGHPTTCLSSMITEWLRKNYNVKFGEPTWRWLVDAVGDPAGGANKALAKQIASRHKAGGMLTRYNHHVKVCFCTWEWSSYMYCVYECICIEWLTLWPGHSHRHII